jgi:2-dehydropantoate 2-reductase
MSPSPQAAAPDYEFAILGAGALGSILGAHLVRAGHSVVMIVRERRAKQIQVDGLRITGLAELSTPVPTVTDVSKLRGAKTLIVAMKTPGTAEALANLRDVEIGAAFSIQNGPAKNDLLVEAFGPSRVLGSLADTSGEMRTDGEVVFTRNVNILLGELSGQVSARATQIASTIDASGVRAAAVESIQSLEWSKFVPWVGLMILSVTTRAATWRYLTDPDSALVLARLVREVGALARALNVELVDKSILPAATLCSGTEADAVAALTKIGRHFEVNAPQHRMSALQDFEAGRPLEIHDTLGYALEKASRAQVGMPLVDAFYHLISAVERIRSG